VKLKPPQVGPRLRPPEPARPTPPAPPPVPGEMFSGVRFGRGAKPKRFSPRVFLFIVAFSLALFYLVDHLIGPPPPAPPPPSPAAVPVQLFSPEALGGG